MHEAIVDRANSRYTLFHVIKLSEMPDGCADLLSVLRICVFWRREASDLKL